MGPATEGVSLSRRDVAPWLSQACRSGERSRYPCTPKSLPRSPPEEADDDGTWAGAQLLHWMKAIHDASEARVALSASGVADSLQVEDGFDRVRGNLSCGVLSKVLTPTSAVD